MATVNAENDLKASIGMDNYDREYIRARTAATSAEFLLGYLKSGLELLDCNA